MKKSLIALPDFKFKIRGLICLIVFIILNTANLSAQVSLSSDELFVKARKLAFDDKNYAEAIHLTKQALKQSPDYADVRIFLGRLYTWTDKPDSARAEFKQVLEKNPEYEDAYLAYGSLEFYTKNSEKGLEIVNQGLKSNEQSQVLLLLKSKLLLDLRRDQEANANLKLLLKINPGLTEARALSVKAGNRATINKIMLSYNYIYFDKQFDDPWHLGTLEYSRETGIGALISRVNIADRFNKNGTQFEIDFYPRLSRVFYAYISGGYSNNTVVFPKYRAGLSLYAVLPSSFEAEAGFRMLNFNEPNWIYTASLGKYYKNYWFNLRTFFTLSDQSVAQSVALNVRYYLGGADDYLSFGIGTGLSPDNPGNNLLYNSGSIYKLKSNNISLGYQTAIKTSNVIFFKGSLANQEYLKATRGNQLELSLGYIKRF